MQQNPVFSAAPVAQVKLSDREKILMGVCPDCESRLAQEEGCKKCYICGFAACG